MPFATCSVIYPMGHRPVMARMLTYVISSLARTKLTLGCVIATGPVYTRIAILRWRMMLRFQVMIDGHKTRIMSSFNAA